MVYVECSDEPTIRINKQEYPHEVVKSRFLKIDSSHIEYIDFALRSNTSDVRNIRAFLITTFKITAVLSPYKTQEIIDKGGLYYGINAISHNLLMCNRKLLLNGNGFILGVSGSGKSFAAKMEILMSALFSNDDIIVIDVEREYGSLIRNLGGEVIALSASSKNHINALEINNDIDMDENPVPIKSEFLISLFDQLFKSNDSRLGGGVGAKDKSISESLPERTLTETFLLSIVQVVIIMSLSQQTAVSVLRQDRGAIKNKRQRRAFLYAFRCLYERTTQPRIFLCCVALLLFFPCIKCRKIKKLLF